MSTRLGTSTTYCHCFIDRYRLTKLLSKRNLMFFIYILLLGGKILFEARDIFSQGRTQGEVLGLTPPLELDILQKLYYKGSV